MTLEETLARLEALGDEKRRAHNRKHGAGAESHAARSRAAAGVEHADTGDGRRACISGPGAQSVSSAGRNLLIDGPMASCVTRTAKILQAPQQTLRIDNPLSPDENVRTVAAIGSRL